MGFGFMHIGCYTSILMIKTFAHRLLFFCDCAFMTDTLIMVLNAGVCVCARVCRASSHQNNPEQCQVIYIKLRYFPYGYAMQSI